MKVLVTGATGYIGSRVVKELVQKKNIQVLGLCRTPEAAESLKKIGVTPVIGDITDPAGLEKVAREADSVLHLAFNHDFSRIQQSIQEDLELTKAFHRAVQGTDKKVIVTAGTLIFGNTQPGKPVDDYTTEVAGIVEKYALENGMSVIRLPPFVYGHAGKGFATMAQDFAKKNGVAAYFGEGSSRLQTVHVDDAARAYVLALEKAVPGHAYHVVGPTHTYKELSEAIGTLTGLEAKSIPASEGPKYFGDFFTFIYSSNNEVSAPRSEKELGWKPSGDKPTLLDDLAHGTYSA